MLKVYQRNTCGGSNPSSSLNCNVAATCTSDALNTPGEKENHMHHIIATLHKKKMFGPCVRVQIANRVCCDRQPTTSFGRRLQESGIGYLPAAENTPSTGFARDSFIFHVVRSSRVAGPASPHDNISERRLSALFARIIVA